MPSYERWKWCQVEGCIAVAEYECTNSTHEHPEGKITVLEIVLNHPRFLCEEHYEMGEQSGSWDEGAPDER